MADASPRLVGEEWQKWANLLLSTHYGPEDYQQVPDNQKGDAGIEGFTRTTGYVFQCYGCEPATSAEKYKKQRDKITADLRKFVDNKVILAKLFGSTKITRWYLVVPEFDNKDLVMHANKKAQEVIEKSLSYVALDFKVGIIHEDQFADAKGRLLQTVDEAIRITCDEATTNAVEQWSDDNDLLVKKLSDKLRKLPTLKTNYQREAFRDNILRWYIEGQELLNQLRNYPELYEKIIRHKRHREKCLETVVFIHSGTPNELFDVALSTLRDDYIHAVKQLAKVNVEALAYEAVGDWLLRCPLEFTG